MLARVCAGVTVPLVGWENPPESTQISRCGGTVARQHTWRCTWQRAPPHILTTYICQLSQLQAPGQHRQHRQPGAGSPLSHSTNIVIYLSSSRQSPASGAAALGHSHTFTSPTLAQLCPWPSQQLSDCKQIKYFLYRFCSKYKVPVLYYQHKFMTFPKRSHNM